MARFAQAKGKATSVSLVIASLIVGAIVVDDASGAVAGDWVHTTVRNWNDTVFVTDQSMYNWNFPWSTATYWRSGVAPLEDISTVYITNAVSKEAAMSEQRIELPTNQSLEVPTLIGDNLRTILFPSGAGGKTFTVGDAANFKGIFRSFAQTPATFAFSSSTTVEQFAADGVPYLKVINPDDKVVVKSILGRGTISKYGPGTMKIMDGSVNMRLRHVEGTVELVGHSYPDALVSGYDADYDASAENVFVASEGSDGREHVQTWKSANSPTVFYSTATNETVEARPFLRTNYANGRTVVDFGAYKGNDTAMDAASYAELGTPAFMENHSTLESRSLFWVQEETSRSNCVPVVVGDRTGAAFHRSIANKYRSPSFSGLLFGEWQPTKYQHGDIRMDGMRVPWNHYEPGGFARMMTYSMVGEKDDDALSYYMMLGSDRYSRFGGMRVGEIVSYRTKLTAEQTRQNNAYLRKKWLGHVPEAVDADVGALYLATGNGGVSVGAGETALVPTVVAGDSVRQDVIKKGDGTLVLDEVRLGANRISVQGGKIAFRDLSTRMVAENNEPADDPLFWAKADASAASFTKELVNGTNFITRWNDWRDGHTSYYAYWDAALTAGKPWIREDALNGLPVVDFGLKSSTAKTAPAMWVQGQPKATEAFVVWRSNSTGYDPWPFASKGDYEFTRSAGANDNRILSPGNASWMTQGALWRVDGETVDPTDVRLGTEYHVINFASSSAASIGALAADRTTDSSLGSRRGGAVYAEILLYDRILTDAERRQTEAYLLKKWKGVDAHPRASAKRLAGIDFANADPELEVNTDLELESITGSGTLKLTGTGTLKLGQPLPTTITKLDAGCVTVTLPDAFAAAAQSISAKAVLDLDASRTDTMTFDADDPTRILKWMDVNGGDFYAVSSKLSDNLPQLVSVQINGEERKTVNLFEFCQTVAGASETDYQSPTNRATGFEIPGRNGADTTWGGAFSAREFFVVMADNQSANSSWTHRGNVVDTRPAGDSIYYRDPSNSGSIVRNDEYATREAKASSYMLDGEDGVPYGRRVTDFGYHVYTISNTNSAYIGISTVGWGKTGGKNWMWGGRSIAEVLYFANPLPASERRTLHDYLRGKWNTGDVSFPVSTCALALNGSTMTFGKNDAVIVSGGISGSGFLVAKRVEVTEQAKLAFSFTESGEVASIDIDGDFALPKEYLVTVSVPKGVKPEPGDYTLLTAKTLSGDASGALAFDCKGRTGTLRVVGNALTLHVDRLGSMILVR